MRPGWASSEPRGQWCAPGQPSSPGRHPPPSSGRPLFSRLLPPTGGSANDEASSRIHLRSPVRPSPACGPPGGTGALGPFPGLRTLQLPAAHAGAGTVLAHWTGSYVTDISRSPFDERHSSHATSCRTPCSSQVSPGVHLVGPRSAEQLVDVVGADPDLLVVVAAQLDVVEHVEVAVGLAILVQPDQRAGDVERHPHRLVALVRDQRVRLARRLVDPVAGGRGPVVLQVPPLAGD